MLNHIKCDLYLVQCQGLCMDSGGPEGFLGSCAKGMARRWREAACGYCPFAFVDLLELIYSSEEWLFAL